MLTFMDIMKLANSEVVFAILFIGFLWLAVQYVKRVLEDNRMQENERETYIMELHKQREDDLKQMLREQREESVAREDKLFTNLEELTHKQGEISETLKDVRTGLSTLEHKMERNITELWKELSKKQSKGGDSK